MSDQIQVRAGDLNASHIGWLLDGDPITLIEHASYYSGPGTKVWTNKRGLVSQDNDILTLSPPEPIRRRITWADIGDTACGTWVDLVPIESSDGTVTTDTPLSWWVPWFIAKDTNWVVIEVPQGHALATAGEAVDG